jgi:hypothetical protein
VFSNAVLNYQVNRAVTLNASTFYLYTKESLTFPMNPKLSNPIQATYLTGQSGNTFFVTLGLTIKIGNTRQYIRDRRFRL